MTIVRAGIALAMTGLWLASPGVAVAQPAAPEPPVTMNYFIAVDWPDNHPDDIDTYVRDPTGGIVWYNRTETVSLRLARDDRGPFRDTVIVDGQVVANPLNREIVEVVRVFPGEYIVNVVHYVARTVDPVPVTVTIWALRSGQMVWSGTVMLDHRNHEVTAIRFTLDAGGNVIGLSHRYQPLGKLAREDQLRAEEAADPTRILR